MALRSELLGPRGRHGHCSNVAELHDKAYVTAADPSSALACASSRPCRRWHRSQPRAGPVWHGKCRTERDVACARGGKVAAYGDRAAAREGFDRVEEEDGGGVPTGSRAGR